MESNKEGAIRALEIAEKRLIIRDYAGAKEMALKAEKLFPQLDSISQLLTVSEVHCSSQLMANGLYDWYKIIQVEPTSDEILIKKQYRKLALLLHPDKNKLPGAEAAFKLVAEANNTLSDRAKRIMYDLKRKHLARLTGPQQTAQTNAAHCSYSNTNRGFTFWTACPGCKTRYQYYSNILGNKVFCITCPMTFVANALQHMNPGPMSGDGGTTEDSNHNSEPITSNSVQRRGKRVSADTSKPIADKNPCPNQNPPSSQPGFNLDVIPSTVDGNQTNDRSRTAGTSTLLRRSSRNKPYVKNNGTEADVSNLAKKARVEVKGGLDGNGTNTNASTCVEREVREQDRERGKEANAINTDTNASTCVEREVGEQDREIHRFSHSVPVYRPNSSERNNNLLEGSLELHTFALPTNLPSVPIESIMPQRNDREGLTNCGGPTPSNGDTSGPTLTRRCQSPQPNADAQNLSTPSNGDTSGPTLNRRCQSPQPNADAQNLSNPNGDTSGPTLIRRCESPQSNAVSQNLYEYPYPNFHNFDMGRVRDHFQRGQMWALYSGVDTYPKYYGWIGKVELDPFKVHISWLDACPKSKVEKLWFDANLPISCGKFKVRTENTIYDNPDYFSHMVSVNYHKRGNYFKILPEVGEIWAVYKNWSARWTLHDLKTCEYDIVQIREQREVSTVVFPMKQVSEYWSVFMLGRIYGSGSNEWEIPYIMFSHRIPAFCLTEEQGGKLRGFWELDPASVPYTFFNHDK